MRIPPSLNGFVSWKQILSIIGIPLETAILPCTMRCPIGECQGDLTILHDENAGGVWAHCRACRFAGDIIELAAAHWEGLDIPTTIRKLVALGAEIPEERILPANLDQYLEQHTDRRQRLYQFWETTRKRLLVDDSKVLRSLQHKLNIRLGLDRDRWLNGPGLFIGGSSKNEAEAALRPLTASWAKGNENVGQERIFRGPNWTDVLVIPLMDVPGRIKSFLFYGRDGEANDTAFRLVRYNGAHLIDRYSNYHRSLDFDAGLALSAALDHHDGRIYVMSDPLLALRLQCWHMQNSSKPAPLVSIYASRDAKTSPGIWSQLVQQPVFWGKPDAVLFRHARASNGKVSLSGFQSDGPQKTFGRTPLQEWLGRIEEDARPWDEVLERTLHALPASEAEAILINMNLEPDELHQFAQVSPCELRERITACCTKPKTAKITVINEIPVREEVGWHNEKTGEQICGAILRIERVIYHKKVDKTYFVGRILFKDTEVPFCELSNVVESETFLWMRNKLLKANVGFLNYARKWESLAIAIATKFYTPEVCQGFDTVGWNDEHTCFVFPDYVITANGDVIDDSNIKLLKRRTPALLLKKPVELLPSDIEELSQEASTQTFWATVVCIAANILAPVFSTEPATIALVGEGAETTGKATAKSLGCIAVVEQPGESLSDICNEHGWPVYIRVGKRLSDNLIDWLSEPVSRNCIVPLNWYAAQVLPARPGWNLIEAGDHTAYLGTCPAACKVLPSFLRYAARQRFKLPDAFEAGRPLSLVFRIQRWLAQWFAEQGGNPETVLSATQVLSIDNEQTRGNRVVTRFTDLLCKLFTDGELSLERVGFIKPDKPITALICFPGTRGELGRIFIPKAVVNKLLATHLSPFLDSQAVTRALKQLRQGTEEDYGGLSGWMISESFWDQRLAAWRADHKFQLKV